MNTDTDGGMNADSAIHQIELELAKAEHGMALPYDAERVGQLSAGLAERRRKHTRREPLRGGRDSEV